MLHACESTEVPDGEADGQVAVDNDHLIDDQVSLVHEDEAHETEEKNWCEDPQHKILDLVLSVIEATNVVFGCQHTRKGEVSERHPVKYKHLARVVEPLSQVNLWQRLQLSSWNIWGCLQSLLWMNPNPCGVGIRACLIGIKRNGIVN